MLARKEKVLSMELTSGRLNHNQLIPGEGYLPNFCTRKDVLFTIIGAEFLAIILSMAQTMTHGNVWSSLAMVSLFVQWVALTCVFILCNFKNRLNANSATRTTFYAYGIIMGVTLVYSLISAWLMDYLYITPRPGIAPELIFRNLVICAIVTAVILRYFYVQHQWKRNNEAENHARIQALQARIRPHFLFNSMNTIASLTRSNPVQAEAAVEDLADLFRVSLADKNMLTLNEEISVTDRYLSIEKHRLGDRLKLEWLIDEDIDRFVKLPALLLQPLVENALYHGIEPLTEGGVVTISLHNLPDGIEVSVANPLSTRTDQHKHKGNQMAQDNIRQRLALAYGVESKLNIQTRDGQYIVSFKIPR